MGWSSPAKRGNGFARSLSVVPEASTGPGFSQLQRQHHRPLQIEIVMAVKQSHFDRLQVPPCLSLDTAFAFTLGPVNHNLRSLPHLLNIVSALSKWWQVGVEELSEGPISSPSEQCSQHCQAQLPEEHTGLTLQTVCGETGQEGRPVGWLAIAVAVLEGSVEHDKPQPSSPGALHGWTGRSQAQGRIDPQQSHERPPHISDSEEGAYENALSDFKL
ncbi:hypothetical protein PAMA_018308 [Pampus argenteus]